MKYNRQTISGVTKKAEVKILWRFTSLNLTVSINGNVRHTLFEIFCYALIFVLALFVFPGDYKREGCIVYGPFLCVYLYHFYVRI